METILSQQEKFVKIGDVDEHDGTILQERALQAFLLRAHKAGHISKDVYERVRPVGAIRPRMYGVPKVHKQGAPLRPILSMVNAPQHALAKWLTEVLQPVVKKFAEHTVRDTFEFCRNIDEFESQQGLSQIFMCSFDVESLFTNIPLSETVAICLDSLYRDDNIKPPSVPENLLKKLLLKATTEVEFSFDNIMYRQTDGVAMGSPLGPILANIFVGYCETKVDTSKWPLFYNRFVDDTFSIFNAESECEDFHQLLNGLHPNLRFTVETENDGCQPFMDVLVQRREGTMIRSVYRKPTFTGQYTRWDSFTPTSHKINLIKSLTNRALKICSESTLKQELEALRMLFEKNGYPSGVVERTMQQTTDKHQRSEPAAESGHPTDFVTLRLPWIGEISNRYRRRICETINSSFPQVKPRVVFTTTSAFRGRAKDVLPTTAKSHVVYKFTCSCGLTYVGKTTQRLSERIKQHISRKLLMETPDLRKHRMDSAITRHLKTNPDCINSTLTATGFTILAQARNNSHLDVLEALFIQRLAPPLCSQKEYVRQLALS